MRPSVGETAVAQPGGRFPQALAAGLGTPGGGGGGVGVGADGGGGGGADGGGGVRTVTPGTSAAWPCTITGALYMM
jgi:hypothetical protein